MPMTRYFRYFLFVFFYALNIYCLPAQTDIQNAQHVTLPNGVPLLKVENFTSPIENPAFIAIYAHHYAGMTEFDDAPYVNKDDQKFFACIEWLSTHLKEQKGLWVWHYDFDHTYNDIQIKAPWYSAFGQAVGIEALLLAHEKSKDTKYVDLAKKAAECFFIEIKDGGVKFQKDNDIWLEEVTFPNDNPPHILNGHMRALIALNKLYEATKIKKYKELFDIGIETLSK